MNARTENLLTDLAKQAGLTLEFPTGEPIRLSGFGDAESPFFEFDRNQPNSDLIFNILEKIGLVPTRITPIRMPWFINRPYQNEQIGEIAYRSRRTIRQMCNQEWRARLWAMCAFVQVAPFTEQNDFLNRHPKYWLCIPLIMCGMLKALVVKIISVPSEFLA
jgi:hypothetical protein